MQHTPFLGANPCCRGPHTNHGHLQRANSQEGSLTGLEQTSGLHSRATVALPEERWAVHLQPYAG